MRTARWLLLVLLAAAGCGDSGPDPTDVDAVPADADHDLVGRWHALPSTADPDPEPELLEFLPGGTAIATNASGTTSSVEWSADDELLTLTYDVADAPPQTETAPFAMTSDRDFLVLRALLPAGPIDGGVIGTWVGHFVDNGVGRTTTLVLDPEGTGRRIDQEDGGEPTEIELTWDGDVTNTLTLTSELPGGETVVSEVRVMVDLAIGSHIYTRLGDDEEGE
jgi:hypothetical protein